MQNLLNIETPMAFAYILQKTIVKYFVVVFQLQKGYIFYD